MNTWLISLVTLAATHATTIDRIRVHSVQADVFEYKFTSLVSSQEPVTLAFNHAGGGTVFARMGEQVGPYTLRALERQRVVREDAHLGAAVNEDQSVAILVDDDGKRYALTMGVPLPQEGHVVCLVSLANGGWLYRRPGEAFHLGGRTFKVQLTPELETRLVIEQEAHPVAPLSQTEQHELEALWQQHHEARVAAAQARADAEAAKARAEREAREQARIDRMLATAQPVAKPPEPSVTTTLRRPGLPRFYVGTDIQYPADFDFVPVVTKRPDGTRSYRAAAVPTRFISCRTGTGLHITYSP